MPSVSTNPFDSFVHFLRNRKINAFLFLLFINPWHFLEAVYFDQFRLSDAMKLNENNLNLTKIKKTVTFNL